MMYMWYAVSYLMYLIVFECVCGVGGVFMLGVNVYNGEKGVKSVKI